METSLNNKHAWWPSCQSYEVIIDSRGYGKSLNIKNTGKLKK